MLAAQPEKSIMNVYNFQKVCLNASALGAKLNVLRFQDQLAMKIVLPEKLMCVAVDPHGMYCAGGTAQGRVYLWEASIFALLGRTVS